MNIFFQRFGLFVLAAVLQRSFFDILWPSFTAPSVLIALIISLVFLSGFETGGLWSLFALSLFALLGEGDQTFFLLAVVIAYATSFLSRRLVIEQTIETSSTLALVAAGFAGGYSAFLFFFTGTTDSVWSIFGNSLEAFLLFPFIFLLLRSWERYVASRFIFAFRGMRT